MGSNASYRWETMEKWQEMYNRHASLEDLNKLHAQGYEFVVEDGIITDIIQTA